MKPTSIPSSRDTRTLFIRMRDKLRPMMKPYMKTYINLDEKNM